MSVFSKSLMNDIFICSAKLLPYEAMGKRSTIRSTTSAGVVVDVWLADLGYIGVYADDCLVDRVMKHKVYIVATNDRDLKRRIRKIPGVPIMSVARGKYVIERLPDAPEK